MKNRGCPKTKGVQKHRVITVLSDNYVFIILTIMVILNRERNIQF